MLHTEYRLLPPAPRLRTLLGPSFILLGLGLGSGEVILWPYLVSNYGLGVAWGAVLGITFQFFINMEIERYTLVHGESVFVGLSRLSRAIPVWLIVSTLLSFGWPGIIASSATLLASVFGGHGTEIAIGLLLLIGVILSVGKYIYTTVEHFSRLIIMLGIPAIVVLTFFFADTSDVVALGNGLVGRGEGFWFLPAGISLATFLGAFAFSGAAGNLNLTQSSYIREKGYGMAAHTEKMKGLFNGQKQTIDVNGYQFQTTPSNIARFKEWWRLINREHGLVFYGLGAFTMLMLMTLSYATTYGLPNNGSGIQFVLNEARYISQATWPILGTFFTLVLAMTLFSTQFSVFDSTSRIMSENFAMLREGSGAKALLSRYYFISLWLQIAFGIIVFAVGLHEPLKLLVIGASINAVCMFVHIGLVALLNRTTIPRELQPAWWRKAIILLAFVFFGVFSAVTFVSLWK